MMIKKLVALLCVIMLSVSAFAACGDSRGGDFEVWTAPATIKVLKRYNEADGLIYTGSKGKSLDITMAQNEYEGAQLIITAKDDISGYNVTFSDLKSSAGEKISKENISAFNQHYIETITKTTTISQQGWYPEALIPFAKAKDAGETKIAKGDNQGIWLKVQTTINTKPGVYTGNIELTVDKKTVSIPMNVTVWDFAISDVSHGRTSFLTYQDSIIQGEGDNSDEMMEAYYEFFLDNRITTAYLPAKADDDDRLLEMIKKYYDHPAMTGYAVPYIVKGSGIDYDRFKALLKKIVELSMTEEKDYLAKAYLYCTLYDEFDQAAQFGAHRKELAIQISGRVDEILVEIVKEFESADKNYFVDIEGKTYKSEIKNSIKNFKNMAVAKPTNEMKDYFNTWTIPATYFNNPARRQEFKDMVYKEGNEVWWYTCVGPKAPEITYHIDDNLISSRTLSWMQKDYDLSGNLYWSTAAYVRRVDGDNERPIDPYTEPRRFGNDPVNGDGYLVYPGAKYGIKGPVASVRTESIRDGQEDFEYLYILDELYKELSETYKTPLDANTSLRDIYDSLYLGTVPYTDVAIMENARNEVAKMITTAKGNEKIVINGSTLTREGVEVSVLIDKSYTIKCDGKEPAYTTTGEGKNYKIVVPFSNSNMHLKFSYSNGNETKEYSRFISPGRGMLTKNDTDADLAKITMTKDGVKELYTFEGLNLIKIKATSVVTGDAILDAAFKPGFIFGKDILGGKEDKIRDLSIKIYNTKSSSVTMYMTCVTDILDVSYTVTLKSGWNTLSFNNISVLNDTTNIFFSFDNLNKTDKTPTDNVIYISDFMYTMYVEG